MDDMAQTLQRTSLRRLGRYLMSGDDVVMGRIEDPLTERAAPGGPGSGGGGGGVGVWRDVRLFGRHAGGGPDGAGPGRGG